MATYTITFAGFTLTATKHGRPTRPAVVKMLRAVGAADRIHAVCTSRFDGMTDGMSPRNDKIDLENLAAFVAKGGPTFGMYLTDDGAAFARSVR